MERDNGYLGGAIDEAGKVKKWAAREEKFKDKLASRQQGGTELQHMEPVPQGPVLEGDGLIYRVSYDQAPENLAPEDYGGDITISGTI
jgi:hypothetical protein